MVAALLLIPLWLDPRSLRELRSVTPSPVPSAAPTNRTPQGRPPATVDAPSGPPVLIARDPFDRVADNNLGTADLGGSYNFRAEGFAGFKVGQGHASVQVGTEGAGWTVLNEAESRDTEMSVSVAFTGSAQGASSAGLVVRATDETVYSLRVVSAAGSASLIIELTTAGPGNEDELLAGPVALPDVSFGAGRVVRLRAQALGSDPTTLRARAWLLGNPEPNAWQISVVDWTGRLQLAGGVGLSWNVLDALPHGVDIEFNDLEVWATDSRGAQ